MNVLKNDVLTLKITDITSEGSGVAHHDSIAVFVENAIPGDTVEGIVIKVAKNYIVAKLKNILIPSPDRIESDCSVFNMCGGCVFRHLSYEAECRIKEKLVSDAFERIGKVDIKPNKLVPCACIDLYRNKAQYPVVRGINGDVQIGFYAKNSHKVIACDDCRLQPPEFENIVKAFKNYLIKYNISCYDEQTGKGLVRHLYIRKAPKTGQIMVCIVINGSELPEVNALIDNLKSGDKNIRSIQVNINREKTNMILGRQCKVLYGSERIEDVLCGKRFLLSPHSFYQVNSAQAELLYKKAAEYAQPEDKVILDLYCGVGTIGLSMADKAKEIIGIEIVEDAVKDAEKNAALNGIKNASFICGDAANAVKMLSKAQKKADVVLLDPPRKGCDAALIDTVADEISPERVVYISCNPATLARDLAVFSAKGYKPEEATPFDLFPRTAHVETVCLLSKLNSEHHIEVDLELDELDLTSSEGKATYEEIKNYVLKTTGLKVSSLYISQVKRKLGLEVGECYNLPKSENAHVPQCPVEKETAIVATLKHFEMI